MRLARHAALSILAGVLYAVPLCAQETGTVTGRVTDAATQAPVAGVSVSVAQRATRTDPDGRYLLRGVPAGTYTLRARMIGYEEATRPVTIVGGDSLVVDFALIGQAVGLSEIVVIGYGEQAVGNVTGAVTQLTTQEFNTGRVISPEQLIQSKVAGVQVADNNEPGGGIAVRIRGATSVSASSDPLYVIDGMPVGTGAGGGLSAGRNPLNFLNPNDIETITVLKDGSAAAIYGANAASGVILIQTKTGQRGTRPEVVYTGTTSASTVTRLPSMLNAAQFRDAVMQHADTAQSNQLSTANTSWFDLVTQTAFGQDHNVDVSGAGEGTSWRLSLGYLNQDGVIRGTTTERLSLGLNFNQQLFDDRLNLRTSLKGSRADDVFTPGGVLSNAAQMGPTQPVYDETSTTGYYEWPGNRLTSADNPAAILDLATDQGTTYRSVGNAQASYRLPFAEALSANANLGYDITRTDRQVFTPSVLHSQTKTGTDGSDYRANQSQSNTVLDMYLRYVGALGSVPGAIDITGGYSYGQSYAQYPWYLAQGLSTDILGGNGVTSARTVQNFQDIQESRLISFFGRVNYNLNDRYLAGVSVRRDGSSRFGPANQWGTFPAFSLGWRISEESFMERFTGISELKLRLAWGRTGNQAFGNYQQYARYAVGDGQTQAQFGNDYVSTIRPSDYNPFIKWESTRSFDVGLDFSILNQRVSGAIDWYEKHTDDLIFRVPVCAGCNLSNFSTQNIGSMRNRGIELSLSTRLRERSETGLSWTADFTAAHNTNELLSIYASTGTTRILTGLVSGGVGTFIQVLQPGHPINSFYVYKQEYDAAGKPIEGAYADLNGDGVINQDDRRPFHDPAPKWIFGHSSYLSYGNVDLSVTLRAYLGNYVYNNVASNLGTYAEVTRGSPYNLHTSVLETGFETPQYLSDYYVEDASFLRLDNVTAAYSFVYRGQPLRVFGTLQNAFTLTGYSGVDPTAGLNGLDNNIYPRARTFTGGLTVRF